MCSTRLKKESLKERRRMGEKDIRYNNFPDKNYILQDKKKRKGKGADIKKYKFCSNNARLILEII